MTEETNQTGYDKAIQQIQNAKEAGNTFIIYIDEGETHNIHIHKASIVDLCQLVTSIYKDRPSVKAIVDAHWDEKTKAA